MALLATQTEHRAECALAHSAVNKVLWWRPREVHAAAHFDILGFASRVARFAGETPVNTSVDSRRSVKLHSYNVEWVSDGNLTSRTEAKRARRLVVVARVSTLSARLPATLW